MNDTLIDLPFRLSTGGLFYQLMLRLRLVEENRYYPWRRIAVFSGLTWLPLLVLTAVDGTLNGGNVNISFLRDPVPHARYLIALPLLVIADFVIDSYVAVIVGHFQASGLVPNEEMPVYKKVLEKLVRLKDAAWADVVLYVVSIGMAWILIFHFGLSSLDTETSSWMSTAAKGINSPTPAGWWHILVSIPFFLFILNRWIWRFIIWVNFMNGISRIRLALQPIHPDQVGGLGLLNGAQFSFGVIFTAVGAMMSSSLASEIIHYGRSLSDVQFEIIGFVLICFVLIAAPLCTFSNQLISSKRRQLRHYSALADLLSDTFHTKWIENRTKDKGKELITAVDPSAVADYGFMYETISSMSVVPLKKRKIILLVLMLVVPFIPLVFTQISIKDALQRLAQTLL